MSYDFVVHQLHWWLGAIGFVGGWIFFWIEAHHTMRWKGDTPDQIRKQRLEVVLLGIFPVGFMLAFLVGGAAYCFVGLHYNLGR